MAEENRAGPHTDIDDRIDRGEQHASTATVSLAVGVAAAAAAVTTYVLGDSSVPQGVRALDASDLPPATAGNPQQ